MRTPGALYAVCLFAACSPIPVSDFGSATLDDWYREEIALPPQFAPEMSTGEEILLFAPGMFDTAADDFWSYVFLMKIEETEMSDSRILELFEGYYDGLLTTVAEGRGENIGDDPATVVMQSLGDGKYVMEIDLVEAFVTMKALHLHLLVEVQSLSPGQTLLRVQASPKAREHKVWSQLDHALRSLSFEN